MWKSPEIPSIQIPNSSNIKTHGSVSAAKKTNEDVWHTTSVLFTGNTSCQIQPCLSPQLLSQFLPNFIYCALHIHYFTYQNWRKLLQHFLRYLFLKIANFLHIFLLGTKLQIYLSHVKITFPCFGFLLNFKTPIMLI